MIKNLIFDFGGVILTIDHQQAIERFASLGLPNASSHLDAYTQGGIFGAIEEGKIDEETFRIELSKLCSRQLTWEDCLYGWLGYAKEVPQRNVEMLKKLRNEGYRLIMLSNTNPFMMSWAMSKDFSKGLDNDNPDGLPARDYFDAAYLSYEVGCMKPDLRFFKHVIEHENINPEETVFVDDGPRNIAAAQSLGLKTMMPENGSDWTGTLIDILSKENA